MGEKTGYQHQQQHYPHYSAVYASQDASKKRNKEEEPQLKCTWHCFCIALKALSGGIFLLTLGTVMSVLGFLAEHNLMTEADGKELTSDQASSLTMYRNLTYAGPVIMGLGGIMVVAALVLTFEVRDTLGVKVAPNTTKPDVTTIGAPSQTTVVISDSDAGTRKSTIASISSTVASSSIAATAAAASSSVGHNNQLLNSTRKLGTEMSLPLMQINVPRDASSSSLSPGLLSSFDRSRVQETIQETTLSSDADEVSAVGAVGGHHQLISPSIHSTARTPVTPLVTDGGGMFEMTPISRPVSRQVSALHALTYHALNPVNPGKSSQVHQYPSLNYDVTPTATASSSIFAVASSSLSALPDPSHSSHHFNHDDDYDDGLGNHCRSSRSRYTSSRNTCDDMFTISSSSGTSQSDHNNTILDHHFYVDANGCLFGFQSPQDVELSDPEGCSLVAPEAWRSSGKCSCSGSPTASTFNLFFSASSSQNPYDDDEDDPYLKDQLFEQQLLQQKLLKQQQYLLQQQQHQLQLQQRLLMEQKSKVNQVRRPKTIASIESDGLSSTSTSKSSLGDHLMIHSSFNQKQKYQTQERVISAASSTTSTSTQTQVTQRHRMPSSQTSSQTSSLPSSSSTVSVSDKKSRTQYTSVNVHKEVKESSLDDKACSPGRESSATLLLSSSPVRSGSRRRNRTRSRSRSQNKRQIGSNHNSNSSGNNTTDSGDNNTSCNNNNKSKSEHGNDKTCVVNERSRQEAGRQQHTSRESSQESLRETPRRPLLSKDHSTEEEKC